MLSGRSHAPGQRIAQNVGVGAGDVAGQDLLGVQRLPVVNLIHLRVRRDVGDTGGDAAVKAARIRPQDYVTSVGGDPGLAELIPLSCWTAMAGMALISPEATMAAEIGTMKR